MPVGIFEFLILTVILVTALVMSGVPLWAAIDASKMQDASWEMAGRDKRSWVLILIGCAVFWGLGFIVAVYYLGTVRRTVAAFERDPNRPTQTPT
ncbi:MAG: hypothetical protein JRH11_03700 [Deltaproteobacteria bacterium]|nr:hypothetical protein [Deltaproteobacteria bacterium]